MFHFRQPELFSPYPELAHHDIFSKLLWQSIVSPHAEDGFAQWLAHAIETRAWKDAFDLLLAHTSTQDDFVREFHALDQACPPDADERIEAIRRARRTLPSSSWLPQTLRNQEIRKALEKTPPVLEVLMSHDRLACRHVLGMVLDVSFARARVHAMRALRWAFPTGTLISEGEEVTRVMLPGGRTLCEMRWELVEDWRPRLVCRDCGHVPRRRDHVEGTPCQRGTACTGHYMGCFVTPGRWMTFIHRTEPRVALTRQCADGIECWAQGESVCLLPHSSDFFESQDWLPCGPAHRPTPEQEWRRQQALMRGEQT